MSPSTYPLHLAGLARAVHDHPPLAEGDRKCEPGILARCGGCSAYLAPCTLTRVDVKSVVSGRFRCQACAGGGPR